jgi:hypothetical protein
MTENIIVQTIKPLSLLLLSIRVTSNGNTTLDVEGRKKFGEGNGKQGIKNYSTATASPIQKRLPRKNRNEQKIHVHN